MSKYGVHRDGKGKVHGGKRLEPVAWAKLPVLTPIPLFLQCPYFSISSSPWEGGKEQGIRYRAGGESAEEESHQRTLKVN